MKLPIVILTDERLCSDLVRHTDLALLLDLHGTVGSSRADLTVSNVLTVLRRMLVVARKRDHIETVRTSNGSRASGRTILYAHLAPEVVRVPVKLLDGRGREPAENRKKHWKNGGGGGSRTRVTR